MPTDQQYLDAIASKFGALLDTSSIEHATIPNGTSATAHAKATNRNQESQTLAYRTQTVTPTKGIITYTPEQVANDLYAKQTAPLPVSPPHNPPPPPSPPPPDNG